MAKQGGKGKQTSPSDKRYQERRRAGLAAKNKAARIAAHNAFVQRKREEKRDVA